MEKAWEGWAECVILILLVGAEGLGCRWEGGLLDRAVEKSFLEKASEEGAASVEEGCKKAMSQ